MTAFTTRILRLAAIPAVALSLSAAHAADNWVTNFESAKTTAAAEKKDLLLDFTGSDWCSWCILLKEEVFSKDEFKEDAPKHFVLVELDYPREKEQPEEITRQNDKLQEDYRVQGFPTILLTDATGRPYAQTGYRQGGAKEYVKHLAELRQIRAARDEAFGKAAGLEGVGKAAALNDALKALDPEIVAQYYQKEIDEILSLDPEDTTGVKSATERRKRREALDGKLQDLASEGKADEYEAAIDQFIETEKLEGADRQGLLLTKLRVYGPDKLDKASALLEEIIRIDSKTEVAEHAVQLQARVAEIRKEIEKSKAEGADKPEE